MSPSCKWIQPHDCRDRLMTRFLLSFVIFVTVSMITDSAYANSFDGITIIEFSDQAGHEAITSGSYIVTFVSERGSYGAVVSDIKGSHGGCQSLAISGSYTGDSITFGSTADKRARKQRLKTYCPLFSLRFEDAATVRVETKGGYSSRRKVIAHIPLRAIDFGAAHFAKHNLKGVKLGPVLKGEKLGGLSRGGVSDRSKHFERKVGMGRRYAVAVMGKVADRKITGWPWDVLYFAQMTREFERKSTFKAFKKLVLKQYGNPSSRYENPGRYLYALWMYDLDGRQITLDDPTSNSCRATAEFSLKYDVRGRVTAFDWAPNSNDLGPWGCNMIMKLNFNSVDGGVEGYAVRAMSGYAKALNHFFQRIEQARQMREIMDKKQGYKPKL